jgi:hypothetical protein
MLALLGLMLCMPALQAQLISVRSALSSDSMMIGDQVRYTLHVEAADNVSFQMPLLQDTLGGGLEILAPLSADTSLADGQRVVEHHYLVTGFEGGEQLIPSQEVLYRFNERVDTARSMPLVMRVVEPEVDTSQQIKAIKPPINTPVSFREVLPWMGLGLGALLLGTLVGYWIWYLRKRRQDPDAFAAKPRDPAHVIAFRELDRLKEQKLWESGQVKAFYTRLTEITRQYIERQYGIPAMESTSDETVQDFRRVNTEGDLLDDMLKELLELADLVKFAKEDPLPVDNQTHLNNAYIFVQKTYPLFYQESPGKGEAGEAGENEGDNKKKGLDPADPEPGKELSIQEREEVKDE